MSNEVYPTDAQVKEFKAVMIPWVRKMVKVKAAVKASISGMGWSKINGQTAFATGTNMYLEDGTIEWFVVTSNRGDGTEIEGTRARTKEGAWKKAAILMHKALMRLSSESAPFKPPY